MAHLTHPRVLIDSEYADPNVNQTVDKVLNGVHWDIRSLTVKVGRINHAGRVYYLFYRSFAVYTRSRVVKRQQIAESHKYW